MFARHNQLHPDDDDNLRTIDHNSTENLSVESLVLEDAKVRSIVSIDAHRLSVAQSRLDVREKGKMGAPDIQTTRRSRSEALRPQDMNPEMLPLRTKFYFEEEEANGTFSVPNETVDTWEVSLKPLNFVTE